MEHLEGRLLLTHFGTSPILLDDGLLIVEGSDANDVVSFGFPDSTTARLTINGVAYNYVRDAIRELDVSGAGGNDRLDAASDVDIRVRLSGGDGDDTLIGGADWDILDSGPGVDSLVGNDGDDEISFKPGDTVVSGNGSDSLSLFVFGTDAADSVSISYFDASTVRLTLNGTIYDYDRTELVSAAIHAGLGDDTVQLDSDVSVSAMILGGDGNDSLVGGAGPDVLDSGVGLDTLRGAGGDDQLIFKPGDVADSGDGLDALVVSVAATASPDVILVENLVDGVTTRLTVNGTTYDYDRAELATVFVDAGEGDDVVTFGADVTAAAQVFGGDGHDTLTGGSGDDNLDGDLGNDSIVGNDGADVLVGFDGSDTIDAGPGDDLVEGGFDTDSLMAGAGNDTISGGAGNDTILGGDGDDVIEGSFAFDYWLVDDPPGIDDDSILGGAGADTIAGAEGSDTINGEADDDVISGGWNNDLLFGGDGNDSLLGDDGTDTLDGGLGYDVLQLFGTDQADVMSVVPLLTGGFAVNLNGELDTAVGAEAVDAWLSLGNDSATVDATVEVDAALYGGDGDDTLLSGHGHDVLVGGAGTDSLNSGVGFDLVRFDGTDGNDIITAAVSAVGQVTLTRLDDTDTVLNADKVYIGGFFGDDAITTAFDPAAPSIAMWLEGHGGNDTLIAGPGGDFIYGGPGMDSVNGGGGDDTILAAEDDDTVLAADGNDLVLAGWGNDSVDAGAGNDTVWGWDDNDTIWAGDGDDSVDGGMGADSIEGGAGADTLVGGAGDDTVDGQVSNDFVYGGLGNDSLNGGDGDDTVGSDQGKDTIHGGSGDDRLHGGLDDDLLDGGDGNDILDGGWGRDRLIGGTRTTAQNLPLGCDNDIFRGGLDDDSLDGGRGVDLLAGEDGVNEITADRNRDIIVRDRGVQNVRHIRKTDLPCSPVRSAARRYGSKFRQFQLIRRELRLLAAESPDTGPVIPPPADVPTVAIRNHGGGHADLRIVDVSFSPSPAQYGGALTYSVGIRNAGPKAAQHVVFYDETSSSVAHFSTTTTQGDCSGVGTIRCEIGRIPDNGKVTITLPGTVVNDTVNPIKNIALVVGGTPTDPDPNNNQTTISVPIPKADLSISKHANADYLASNGWLDYQINVLNSGPDSATGIVIEDTIPGGTSFKSASANCSHNGGVVTCTIPLLEKGYYSGVWIRVWVDSTTVGTISNTAEVYGNEPDPNPDTTNNQASVVTDLPPGPAQGDLSLTKDCTPDTVVATNGVFGNVTCTLTASITGATASNVRIIDTLPRNTVFVSATSTTATGSPGTCTGTRQSYLFRWQPFPRPIGDSHRRVSPPCTRQHRELRVRRERHPGFEWSEQL